MVLLFVLLFTTNVAKVTSAFRETPKRRTGEKKKRIAISLCLNISPSARKTFSTKFCSMKFDYVSKMKQHSGRVSL